MTADAVLLVDTVEIAQSKLPPKLRCCRQAHIVISRTGLIVKHMIMRKLKIRSYLTRTLPIPQITNKCPASQQRTTNRFHGYQPGIIVPWVNHAQIPKWPDFIPKPLPMTVQSGHFLRAILVVVRPIGRMLISSGPQSRRWLWPSIISPLMIRSISVMIPID